MSDDKAKLSAVASFNRYLSERKLRRTPERYAILAKALEMSKHFSVETLAAEMERDSYHVSLATVYNTVSHLAQAGIIRSHRFGRTTQYEVCIDAIAANHQHLVCLKCGKIREIKDPALMKLLAEKRFQSFSTEYFTVYVYGICSQCQRRNRKKTNKNLNK